MRFCVAIPFHCGMRVNGTGGGGAVGGRWKLNMLSTETESNYSKKSIWSKIGEKQTAGYFVSGQLRTFQLKRFQSVYHIFEINSSAGNLKCRKVGKKWLCYVFANIICAPNAIGTHARLCVRHVIMININIYSDAVDFWEWPWSVFVWHTIYFLLTLHSDSPYSKRWFGRQFSFSFLSREDHFGGLKTVVVCWLALCTETR